MNRKKNLQVERIEKNCDGGGSETLQIVLELILLLFKSFLAICKSIFRKVVQKAEKVVEGEVVLVTGAGHGIGKEVALQYADLGAIVVCWDINEQANKATVNQIKEKGKIVYGFTCDVTKRDLVVETVEKIKRKVGNITILINNAGTIVGRSLLETDEKEIRKIMDVNVMSHFWILQSVLPGMIENNYGHIVEISSCAGLKGIRNVVPYCTSKFAVYGMMSALREELRFNPKNEIQLTTILPYIVDTGFSKSHVVRFSNVFKDIPTKEAARCIISAQRRNVVEETIPSYLLVFNHIQKLLPMEVQDMILDFLGIYYESDRRIKR